VQTIGPVMSDGGFKNWYLCLARDAILAVPLGIWRSVLLGVGAGTGNPLAAQQAYARSPEVEGERILTDAGDPGWRRYPVAELERIMVKKPFFGANEIRIQRRGEKAHVYGIGDRSHTKECRIVLNELYGPLYAEEGFTKPPQRS
jgi:hypothetical protein